MVSGHVDALFSAAYDGELSADARATFDRHLAECPACASGLAQLTTVVDALREMGPARMPRPVRLPEGSPLPARRFGALRIRLPRGRGLVAGLTAAGMLAAAGVATVVVLGRLGPQGALQSAGRAAMASSAGLPRPEAPTASGSACAGNCFAAAPSSTCVAQPLGTDAAEAAEAADVPAGFGNADVQNDGITKVVLATQADSFAPGATVDIYARVIDDGTGAVSLPCTYLSGPAVAAPQADNGAGAMVPEPTILATPVGRLTVDNQPLLQVVVPKSAASGETFQVVVEVPAGSGEPQTRQVSLSIQVS